MSPKAFKFFMCLEEVYSHDTRYAQEAGRIHDGWEDSFAVLREEERDQYWRG